MENKVQYNKELYQLYDSPGIVTNIKLSRLRWAGHLQRREREDVTKRIMESKVENRRNMRDRDSDGWMG